MNECDGKFQTRTVAFREKVVEKSPGTPLKMYSVSIIAFFLPLCIIDTITPSVLNFSTEYNSYDLQRE